MKNGQVSYKSLLPAGMTIAEIWQVHCSGKWVYFFSSETIYCFNGAKLNTISVPLSFFFGFKAHNQVFAVLKNKGIAMLSEDQLIPVPGCENFPTDNFITILPFADQKLLLVGPGGNFFIHDLSPSPPQPFLNDISPLLDQNNIVYCAIRVNLHEYAFGTIKQGILIMDEGGKLVNHYHSKNGLPQDTIWGLYADRENNLWAASEAAVTRIEIAYPIDIFSKTVDIETANSLIIFDKKLYIGTNSGIFSLPMTANPGHKHRQTPQIITKDIVSALCFYKIDDILLVGTANSILQIQQHQIVNSYPSRIVYWLTHHRNFLISGQDDGIGIFTISEEKEKFKLDFIGKVEGIHETIRPICTDKNGNIWGSSFTHGVYLLKINPDNPLKSQFRHFKKGFELIGNFSNLVQNLNHHIFIASPHGVFQPQTDSKDNLHSYRIERIPEFKNFPDNAIFILASRNSNLYWFYGEHGIGSIKFQPHQSPIFQLLPIREFFTRVNSLLLDEQNILWIGADIGLYRYNTNQQKNFGQSFFTLIRQVTVGKNNIIFHGAYYQESSQKNGMYPLLAHTQPSGLIHTLSYKENSVKFDFSAAYFEHKENNLYRFKLEKFDPDWSEWKKETFAIYTNIPEGSYTFRATGKNQYGTEGTNAVFIFFIKPPWFRTPLAYFGYLILFFAILFGSVRFNSNRLIIAKKRLEKIVFERTAELIKQRDKISVQKEEIEIYAGNLVNINQQLSEARNALWGEMILAKKIQTVLLPTKLDIPGYEISAYMKPADEVGGDYYDIINRHDHNWVVIGDVSGHGVSAGLIMMMVQTAIRTALDKYSHHEPNEILEWINRIIFENIQKLGEQKYMTITLMSLQQNGQINYSGLHQDILIYRTASSTIDVLETKGMWIGITDQIEGLLQIEQLQMNPGDVLLLFTDGIVEAIDNAGKMFSDLKLRQLFQKLGQNPLSEIHQGILNSLIDYKLNDDITFVLIKKI
jgi:serine phosphatase RsbU (regulator of sigma subunit)